MSSSSFKTTRGLANWLDFEFAFKLLRVRVPSGSLEAYIVVNFRAHEISQGTYKLTRTSMLIKKIISLYRNGTSSENSYIYLQTHPSPNPQNIDDVLPGKLSE